MRILRTEDVAKLIGLSRATIFRNVKAGIFPAPIKISQRAVGWRSEDIETWIVARAAAYKAQDDD
jgi:prophage regulatory protein